MILYAIKKPEYVEISRNKKRKKDYFLEKEMACVRDFNGAVRFIQGYCERNNFHLNYIRKWERDGEIYIDYGSHDELFLLV